MGELNNKLKTTSVATTIGLVTTLSALNPNIVDAEITPSDIVADDASKPIECTICYDDGSIETLKGNPAKTDMIQHALDEAKERGSTKVIIKLPEDYKMIMTHGVNLTGMDVTIEGDYKYPATIYNAYEYYTGGDVPFHTTDSQGKQSRITLSNIKFQNVYSDQYVYAYGDETGILDVSLKNISADKFDTYFCTNVSISDSTVDNQAIINCENIEYNNCKIRYILSSDNSKTFLCNVKDNSKVIVSGNDNVIISGLESKETDLRDIDSATIEGLKMHTGVVNLQKVGLGKIELCDIGYIQATELPISSTAIHKCSIRGFSVEDSGITFDNCLFSGNNYTIDGIINMQFDECINSSGDHLQVRHRKTGERKNIPFIGGAIKSDKEGHLFKELKVPQSYSVAGVDQSKLEQQSIKTRPSFRQSLACNRNNKKYSLQNQLSSKDNAARYITKHVIGEGR